MCCLPSNVAFIPNLLGESEKDENILQFHLGVLLHTRYYPRQQEIKGGNAEYALQSDECPGATEKQGRSPRRRVGLMILIVL